MAKDLLGNKLYESDLVQFDLPVSKCIGIIKEIHRDRAKVGKRGKPAPRTGFIRVVTHFDIPVSDSEKIIECIAKVMNPDYHKRLYGESQPEPEQAVRVTQDLLYDHKGEEETVNMLQG